MGFSSKIDSLWGRHPRLGTMLVREGLITKEQLATALEEQRHKGSRLGYQLVKLGMVSEEALGHFLAEKFHVPTLDEESLHLHADLFREFPRDLLVEHELFPLHRAGRTLTLVMADPSDEELLASLSKRLGLSIHPVVAPQSVIRKRLADYFALQEIAQNLRSDAESEEILAFFTGLKDYRFEKVLGVGGFGMVCKYWQISLDRPVAIKTLSRQMTQTPGMAERFKREGKIIASLNHPSIIQVYEQGETHGLLYIVMQYFKGQPLDNYCRGKDLMERIGCLIPLCDALHYAGQQGVVHRDLKPANILASDAGEVKLLDFGVAHVATADGDPRLTTANVVLGTPRYMAPECFTSAAEAGPEVDIYSMGVIAYELLTETDCPPPPRKPPQSVDGRIPQVLSQAILKALEVDKSARLSSFDLFKRALSLARDQLLMGSTVAAQRGALFAPLPGGATSPSGNVAVKSSLSQTTLRAAAAPPAAPPNERQNEAAMHACYDEERVLRDDPDARVVLARHHRLGRRVVIRELHPRNVQPEVFARLADLKHPSIGQILSTAIQDDKCILIEEYLEGGSAADRMQAGAVPAQDFIVWADDLVAALEMARQRGVPHGRLHPGNLLFTASNRLKVVGFGVAGPRSTQFARFGRPEMLDPWEADRYALGVMWFEMLTGERFRGASTFEQNFRKLQEKRDLGAPVKVPLGRLWGIQRYGRKYENYADMSEDLRFLREKLAPEVSLAVPGTPGTGSGARSATAEKEKPWWALWR